MKIRDEYGKWKTVPEPRFENDQLVTTSKGTGGIVRLSERKYTGSRGWIYGNEYARIVDDAIVTGGGYSFYWGEDKFEPISDPKILIMVEIFYRETEQRKIKSRLETLRIELGKLQFTLSLITPITQEAGNES